MFADSYASPWPITAVGQEGASETPAELLAFFSERLEEARAALAAISPADLALEWKRSVAFAGVGVEAGLPVQTPFTQAEIGKDDRIRVNDRGRLTTAISEAAPKRLHLFRGRQELLLPPECAPLLNLLVTRGEFRAGDAVREDSDWTTVRCCLEVLASEGIVERASSSALGST
jgi:hypothetical protein